MTYKKRTLAAFKSIIKKIQDPIKDEVLTYRVGFHATCPLCKVHMEERCLYNTCTGCPLANSDRSMGCYKKSSYLILSRADEGYKEGRLNSEQLKKEYLRALPEVEKMLKYVKRLSPKRFTKKGWKFIDWSKIL